MKNKKLIAILVIVIALIGVVYFFVNKRNTKSSETINSTADANSPKSLKELLGLGLTQKCTFDKGTVYIASGKMRGDFDPNTHMITEGEASYLWTDGEKTGYKMTFDPNSVETSGSTGLDYDQKSNYNCNSWSLDASVFELPKDVKFQDFSSLIPTANPEKSGSNSSQCSYCGTLTGDDKTQCLSALNCN